MDYLKRGAEIEISSNDEGFRGSWYAGTVIRRLNKTRVLVEYNTIIEDEVRQTRVTEIVDMVQLRPPPPRETHPEFKLSDEVDAYHHDGWWEGVITKVLKDGRFTVFFRPHREEMNFKPSQLRLHREWVDYERWVPPLQTQEAEEDKEVATPEKPKPVKETFQINFSQGAKVEVKTDEEGFQGAWLSATIVKQLNKDKYLVRYQNLRNEENTALLIEEADGSYIRPKPPDTAVLGRFKVLQKVDAFFNDCWWTGVISKVLKDQKYVVDFIETEDEMEFKHCDLRVHQDWIDGKWIKPSQAEKL